MARTARRQLEGRQTSTIWRIFAELNNPERALSTMNLTSMEVSMFFVVARDNSERPHARAGKKKER